MLKVIAPLAVAAASVAAETIAQINGNTFLSPLRNQNVTGVVGLVTAKNNQGVFLRSTEPDEDPTTSEGLFVFGGTLRNNVQVGDIISIDGRVEEYRSNNLHGYLTELTGPRNLQVISSNNTVTPLVIGVDTPSPPTELFSSLDEGGVFGAPNAVNLISTSNPELDPTTYGLDFWESLVGELVTIKDAYQIGRPNQFGDTWVRGDWKVTGVNSQGGVTMLGSDANPETILIGSPLDGSRNPSDTKMGDYLGDITGTVYNAFGFYRILPTTRLTPLVNSTTDFPPVSFESRGTCRGITVASYNARNLEPRSPHMPGVAEQIVTKMLSPDIICLQEVQDDSGEANDGVVTANLTLTTLVGLIEELSGVVYDFTEIAGLDNQDGGAPGGNIRVAYLYRPDVVELYQPNLGGPLDVNEVLEGANGEGPVLKFNPGRIEPSADAWANSRKPLAAMWKTVKGTGKLFFTVNVHFTSKGGSSTLHGDPRPPINNGIEKRNDQATITADFIAQILALDPAARMILSGDMNEFVGVAPISTLLSRSGLLDLEDVVGIQPAERYTYLFDNNCQALDHMFISPSLSRGALYEHLHLNTWQNYNNQVSDHDMSVARLNMCGCVSKL
ncbi:Endonuclease/exonuclease/phosphatase [Stachybotrys elegans]|uniref:Endonuclease/exonuclease/phosphatase n=1 Tax=Stachybotrys elegans TaxID=80388 RepID=A0A8K0WQ52_9HYPO|nr:Endonuclease/exonuclease/phosphatase [Stachybotrys elegans]